MDAIIFFFVGLICGWFWHAKTMFKRILQNPQEMITLLEKYKVEVDKDQKENKGSTRPVKVERHGEQIYLFAEDTNEFLAQGTTIQEALAVIEKRFPNETFQGLLSKEEADKLGISVK
jgi:type II secretory pathway component PulF